MRLLNDGDGEPESRRARRQRPTARCRSALVFIAMAMAPCLTQGAAPPNAREACRASAFRLCRPEIGAHDMAGVRACLVRNFDKVSPDCQAAMKAVRDGKTDPDAQPAAQGGQPALKPAATSGPALSGATPIEVPLETERGTFVVPVRINDTLTLKFTLDSGASDVSIPADVVSTLVRAGTITVDDFVGSQTVTMADGSTVPSAEFRIRSLRVGNLVIRDVIAFIAPTRGSLLLGQTFLTRLSGWSIDNKRRLLILSPTEAAEPLAGTPSTTATASPDVRDALPTSSAMNLLCRVRETRPGGAHRELLRRIELELAAQTVRFYDDVGRGWVFKREGSFVSVDAHRIVLDADGGKDSYVDRLSGEYYFHNQKDDLVISGHCERTGEFGLKF